MEIVQVVPQALGIPAGKHTAIVTAIALLGSADNTCPEAVNTEDKFLPVRLPCNGLLCHKAEDPIMDCSVQDAIRFKHPQSEHVHRLLHPSRQQEKIPMTSAPIFPVKSIGK